VQFVFAREKAGKIHFRRRHPEVTVREVEEVFEFRMAVQPAFGGAIKGIGHTRARRFLVVIFRWGRKKDGVFILTAYPARRRHVEVYVRTVGGLR
jgi:hypothetical protein